MTVSATFNDRYIVVNSTQIARFSFKTFTTDRSFKKMVVARDRKHHADVKCEKHRFPRTLPMIFDRLSRHLGFSNLARLISRVSNLGLLYLWLHQVYGYITRTQILNMSAAIFERQFFKSFLTRIFYWSFYLKNGKIMEQKT